MYLNQFHGIFSRQTNSLFTLSIQTKWNPRQKIILFVSDCLSHFSSTLSVFMIIFVLTFGVMVGLYMWTLEITHRRLLLVVQDFIFLLRRFPEFTYWYHDRLYSDPSFSCSSMTWQYHHIPLPPNHPDWNQFAITVIPTVGYSDLSDIYFLKVHSKLLLVWFNLVKD